MKSIKHPAAYIAPELVSAMRNAAADAEQLKELHPVQLEIIHEEKWFQLFVPKQYNGLAVTLPEALQIEEALAWTDGAVGWTVTLCAGAGWFVGFFDPEIAAGIFNNPTVCIAGSGKTTGTARITNDGYEINGKWDYATGANHATVFTANCMIEENNLLLKNADGSPVIMPFVFFTKEVVVHENWKRIGMIATGSNTFEVSALKVPANRAFHIDPRYAVLKEPVYQYPFLQFAETTLAVNSSGMAMRFLDMCKILFEQRATAAMQSALTKAIECIETARQDFYKTVNDSWTQCSTKLYIADDLLQEISRTSKHLAITARQIVDELYPYCGMQAANPETEINRVWRNLHTASQHSLFNT